MKISDSVEMLRKAAQKNNFCAVFYSGGKDSLVVTDLCAKVFERITLVHMYMFPGYSVAEKSIAHAKAQWGLDVVQYPHWVAIRALKTGIYCFPSRDRDLPQNYKLADLYAQVVKDTGCGWIATGAKNADSFWRRRNLASIEKSKNYEMVVNPIKDWSKYDVLAYVRTHKLEVQEETRGNFGGVGLKTLDILSLHDHQPEDYQKLLKTYPFAAAVVRRRELYGSKEDAGKENRAEDSIDE